MFDNLQDRLDGIFKKLRRQAKLNENNVKDALREVRLALLEADVNYKVVKDFIEQVNQRAVGTEVLRSLTPGQQMIKIVHEELIALMGSSHQRLNFGSQPPTVIMMVGLQGSGKTTTCGKLAHSLITDRKRPIMVAADVYRPAADEQLRTIGRSLNVEVFSPGTHLSPVIISQKALNHAQMHGFDPVILDTAGRLHVDEQLMEELVQIKKMVTPTEILFVADAMTGQDAVNVAQKFDELLDLSGIILTKMDGDARGGAALSIRAVTGKPIKFIGVGEKFDLLEPFHPDRMASRILGMGDVLTLIEKAETAIDKEKAQELARKIKKQEFSLKDFQDQLRQIKKMGPLDQIFNMIPGMSKMNVGKELEDSEGELKKIDAIINSMTMRERESIDIINLSRKKRIARGSATSVQEVNRLLKQFVQMRKMMKRFTSGNKPMNLGMFR
ncbi:signal recognition particle protein [candidate division CSSED10-310 bacterium]|uniref:Signal recognition particle protein n=1 Tax=candidate division CSSED10-310 bacterium TaxID=2855610 RepID=A0ABV6YZ59_UNCC1